MARIQIPSVPDVELGSPGNVQFQNMEQPQAEAFEAISEGLGKTSKVFDEYYRQQVNSYVTDAKNQWQKWETNSADSPYSLARNSRGDSARGVTEKGTANFDAAAAKLLAAYADPNIKHHVQQMLNNERLRAQNILIEHEAKETQRATIEKFGAYINGVVQAGAATPETILDTEVVANGKVVRLPGQFAKLRAAMEESSLELMGIDPSTDAGRRALNDEITKAQTTMVANALENLLNDPKNQHSDIAEELAAWKKSARLATDDRPDSGIDETNAAYQDAVKHLLAEQKSSDAEGIATAIYLKTKDQGPIAGQRIANRMAAEETADRPDIFRLVRSRIGSLYEQDNTVRGRWDDELVAKEEVTIRQVTGPYNNLSQSQAQAYLKSSVNYIRASPEGRARMERLLNAKSLDGESKATLVRMATNRYFAMLVEGRAKLDDDVREVMRRSNAQGYYLGVDDDETIAAMEKVRADWRIAQGKRLFATPQDMYTMSEDLARVSGLTRTQSAEFASTMRLMAITRTAQKEMDINEFYKMIVPELKQFDPSAVTRAKNWIRENFGFEPLDARDTPKFVQPDAPPTSRGGGKAAPAFMPYESEYLFILNDPETGKPKKFKDNAKNRAYYIQQFYGPGAAEFQGMLNVPAHPRKVPAPRQNRNSGSIQ